MQHAVDLNGGDSSATQRRQKNAPQRIAERQTEAAFQRFSNERDLLGPAGSELHLRRLDQFLPVFLYHVSTFRSPHYPIVTAELRRTGASHGNAGAN
nr:hypothetical protein [Marinicella sp. W31]MDC2876384.1 hypothetical protein [Marinicella sp. W31]